MNAILYILREYDRLSLWASGPQLLSSDDKYDRHHMQCEQHGDGGSRRR